MASLFISYDNSDFIPNFYNSHKIWLYYLDSHHPILLFATNISRLSKKMYTNDWAKCHQG
jgi:hypothetical protein